MDSQEVRHLLFRYQGEVLSERLINEIIQAVQAEEKPKDFWAGQPIPEDD